MVFIANIESAGVGITLTVSHVLIFNDFDYVPGNNRQMEDRIYRIGQAHDVDIYYQMFNGTQYKKMWEIVLRKEVVINSVIKKEDDK
jgi:SWI/SNF-related matrix-associated actin-dependent regulator 1 of chromatin subfamily A